MLVVDVPNRVRNNHGVTISILVILVNKLLLVRLPAFRRKLLGFEERAESACLVRLRESSLLEQTALYLGVRKGVVAFDEYLAHLHLLLLVDDDVEDNLIFLRYVVTLDNLYVGVLESLVVEVFLGKNLRAVNHVRRNLCAFEQSEFLLHVRTFRLLQSHVVDGRDTRSHLEVDMEVGLVLYERVNGNGHFREESVLPVVLDGVRYLVARQINLLSHGQSRDAGKHIVLIAIGS